MLFTLIREELRMPPMQIANYLSSSILHSFMLPTPPPPPTTTITTKSLSKKEMSRIEGIPFILLI